MTVFKVICHEEKNVLLTGKWERAYGGFGVVSVKYMHSVFFLFLLQNIKKISSTLARTNLTLCDVTRRSNCRQPRPQGPFHGNEVELPAGLNAHVTPLVAPTHHKTT